MLEVRRWPGSDQPMPAAPGPIPPMLQSVLRSSGRLPPRFQDTGQCFRAWCVPAAVARLAGSSSAGKSVSALSCAVNAFRRQQGPVQCQLPMNRQFSNTAELSGEPSRVENSGTGSHPTIAWHVKSMLRPILGWLRNLELDGLLGFALQDLDAKENGPSQS